MAYAACLRPWCYLFNVTYDVISTRTHTQKKNWFFEDGLGRRRWKTSNSIQFNGNLQHLAPSAEFYEATCCASV